MNRLNRSERTLGWLLCLPAAAAMLLVSAYPIVTALWLSLFRYDLRFPARIELIGFDNYLSVLSSKVWWQAVANTLFITLTSVCVELLLGFGLAVLMHRALRSRRLVRSAVLVPYAMITVVAALAWQLAFDPITGFINSWLGLDLAWFSERSSAFFVIIFTDVWKTTPFVALLILSGLTQIPEDLIRAAKIDGASAWQRFYRITLPLLKPILLVAVLFRSLDAFRIFDSVYVQTRGALDTESVSLVAYQTLIARLNLGLGSAVAILIFCSVCLIAFLLIKVFRANFAHPRGGRS